MKKTLSLILVAVLLVCTLLTVSCSKDPDAKAKVIDIKLTDEEYAFGVDKNQPELLEKVNAFIKKIKENGKFDEICNHYFGDGEPVLVESKEEDSSKNQLIVATNAEFEPFEFTKGNYYLGIDMEIAALLAEELGMELVIKHMEFNAVCLSVSEGKCDIAMAGLTVDETRKQFVTFTDSYYYASQKIVVKADDTSFDNCKTADDVIAVLNSFGSDKKAGAQTTTTGQFFIEGDEELEFPGFDVTFVGYSSGTLAVQDMLKGKLDFVVIDEAPAAAIVKGVNG